MTKVLRKAEEIVADLVRYRDHLWETVGMKAGPLPEVAMRLNSILYRGYSAPPEPYEGWCYDLEDMPIKPGERFLGLWHYGAPDRDIVQIIWAADQPFPGSMPALYYLTHAGNEAPHYVNHPHAWARLPKIKRPGT